MPIEHPIMFRMPVLLNTAVHFFIVILALQEVAVGKVTNVKVC
jgi:hypothetical protein